MRILMVENHELFARTVIDQFLFDHRVDVVGGIARAKEMMIATTYDVALVDHDLDDGKGVTLVQWIRTTPWRGRIIGISAKDAGNDALRGAGAHATCPKGRFHTIGFVLAGS